MKRTNLFFIFIFLFCHSFSLSQTGKITIKSNTDSCLIFIDSLYIGKTPVIDYVLNSGLHSLKAINKEPEAWDKQTIEKEIKIDSGSTGTVSLEFRQKSRIITEPDNAEIFLNNRKAGNTPAEILYNTGDTLTIIKENYEKICVILNERRKNTEIYTLSGIIEQDIKKSAPEINGTRNTYYALIGGGLAFGIVSVLAKHKADNLETDYRNGPTDALKSSIRKYDLVSGISLGLFEACFLALSYLLLSD